VADEVKCDAPRAVADIAAGAIARVLHGRTKANIAYMAVGGMVLGGLFGMVVAYICDDPALLERCLFALVTAGTTAISTFMGVNAALSGRNGNGNGTKE